MLKLTEGLQTCRAIVENYRLMLGGAANDNAGEELAAQTEASAEADEA